MTAVTSKIGRETAIISDLEKRISHQREREARLGESGGLETGCYFPSFDDVRSARGRCGGSRITS